MLVICCCITNYPQNKWLKTICFYYLLLSLLFSFFCGSEIWAYLLLQNLSPATIQVSARATVNSRFRAGKIWLQLTQQLLTCLGSLRATGVRVCLSFQLAVNQRLPSGRCHVGLSTTTPCFIIASKPRRQEREGQQDESQSAIT